MKKDQSWVWKGRGENPVYTDTVIIGGIRNSRGKVWVDVFPYDVKTKRKGTFSQPIPYDDFKRDFDPMNKGRNAMKKLHWVSKQLNISNEGDKMKWTITGRYRSGNKHEIMGNAGKWTIQADKTFSIEVSRFSEVFSQRDYPMMPVPSGRGTDIVDYRMSKDKTGVVLDQIHLHSTKPVKMFFRRAIHELKINGETPSKDMLEKAVKFIQRKH